MRSRPDFKLTGRRPTTGKSSDDNSEYADDTAIALHLIEEGACRGRLSSRAEQAGSSPRPNRVILVIT